MIAIGKSISHTKASINYGWNEEKDAKIVFKNYLAGDTPYEITEEFKTIQAMNKNCLRNTFSFVLSPTISDGNKLTIKDLNKITKEFISDLKLDEHQAIAFVHNDKQHKHIHLYLNRIDFNGNAYKDNYISKRAQKAGERVAKKLDLTTVREVQKQKLENLKDIRRFIKEKHDWCFKNLKIKEYSEYITAMKQFNIVVKPVCNKSEKLQGFRYIFKDVNLKASEVNRNMSFNNLNKQIQPKSKSIKL